MNWQEQISIDPWVCDGRPCVEGSRWMRTQFDKVRPMGSETWTAL